jgi:hypothetical protein
MAFSIVSSVSRWLITVGREIGTATAQAEIGLDVAGLNLASGAANAHGGGGYVDAFGNRAEHGHSPLVGKLHIAAFAHEVGVIAQLHKTLHWTHRFQASRHLAPTGLRARAHY